ncbi:hypothetical protein IAT38_007278 [Cryptococcus sp. DSM 104549]
MFLYNVHAPNKTFALTYKEGESQSKLFSRIWAKAGLDPDQKSKTGLVYEFEGSRWSLDDDDDLQILHSRFPPTSTPSATLHLQPPAGSQGPQLTHFAASPPAYSTAGSTKPKKSPAKSKKPAAAPSVAISEAGKPSTKPNGSALGHGSPSKTHATIPAVPSPSVTPHHSTHLAPPVNTGRYTTGPGAASVSGGAGIRSVSGATSVRGGRAKSVGAASTRSRRSKWGDDDAEPLGVVKRRAWEEFHNNNGVRTVVGKVGDTPNVRMLLKSGYRHVYVSRDFAIRAKLVPKKFALGAGYTGLRSIGQIPITVGSRTALHTAYISEEPHFDVILGRAWIEKMAIKIDPLDQTVLTYMDTGEPIACDVVVLKNDKGDIITIT